MTKKKRHIRWDRVILLIETAIIIVALIGHGINWFIEYKKKEDTKVTTNITELPYVFPSLLPKEKEMLSIKEFTKIMEELFPETRDDVSYLGEFLLTGYCNCPICCGVWSGGPCYNGEMPESEWTIAVDPDVIPLNSYVMINGRKYKACDTGSAIIGNHIDIYCDSHEECFNSFCNGYTSVYLIEG